MRPRFIFFSICFLFLLQDVVAGNNSLSFYPIPDTVPPPPYIYPDTLTGPSSACVGDTSEYTVDVPVACHCEWSVNGIVQQDTVSPFVIIWDQPGLQTVTVVVVCENGQSSEPQSMDVIVNDSPDIGPITGETEVCEYSSHDYSITAGPYDSCSWLVNGVIQPGYAAEINYAFGAAGNYHFEVTAFNNCGTSQPQTLDVTAQGTAPAPPGPVQGPGESCEGFTETYTTTVGAGESCAWWVDEVMQSSTSTTLEVTWSQWGIHFIEVRAVTDCGTGNPAFKNVAVMYEPEVFLGNDTTLLEGQALVLDAGNPGSDYLWSTGETTQTIQVTNSGAYSVNVSNFCGEDNDTIEVTFYVGISESADNAGCFSIISGHRRVDLTGLPQNTANVKLVSLSGIIIYDGFPSEVIYISNPGIYFIRVTTPEKTCYKKVFIR